jgi:hypothetical protein
MKLTQFGAFTQQTANMIATMIAQSGFATTGNIYYLDPANGNDNNDGSQPTQGIAGVGPVATLAGGYALLVSGNNDILVLIGNGATSSTARLGSAFTWAKSAAHFIGISSGSRFSMRSRVAPTLGVTAFKNLFTLSGNGCYFANIEFFHGFTVGTTAEICMAITGSRNVFRNCQLSGMGDADSAGAASTTSRSLTISTDENYFDHCVIGLDTVARSVLNASVEFSNGAARNVFEDCIFPVLATTAASSLVVICAAAAAIDRMTIFKRCLFYNAAAFSGGAAATGVMKLLAAAGGAILLQDCTEYGFTDWGYDAASKLEILVSGPVPTSSSSGIAVVNT